MKSIFVTGAASGIGRATAQLFGGRGFAVGCWDVDVDGARTVAEALPNASHGRLDVTNEESWSAAIADFEASYGRMDVWRAAHGRSLHYIPQFDVSLLGRLSAVPAVTRTIMNFLAKRDG